VFGGTDVQRVPVFQSPLAPDVQLKVVICIPLRSSNDYAIAPIACRRGCCVSGVWCRQSELCGCYPSGTSRKRRWADRGQRDFRGPTMTIPVRILKSRRFEIDA
jgi:hypothetical protein